ncbi:ICMT-domain-containing protein [Trametes coccinea BRFM310]|uniref:Protein-S-isoprenylcysteine O-methyltransferase n=1 Tax=Trametes coccinea (strain BRFM310) TaxID=1353009 RepID=A0A1Y2IF17_TRAC3|nr:ICMT-domain-containing protein [Trametes coccinea BRFM310]
MSSLLPLKVPALVAAIISEHIAWTSPNPAPSEKESEKFGKKDPVGFFSTVGPRIGMASGWLTHGGETLAILARMMDSPLGSAQWIGRLRIHPAFVLGAALVVFGGAVRKACYNTMGHYFTYQLALVKDHKLVTWGPYSVVRHPSYVGALAVSTGQLLMQFAPGSMLVESGALDSPTGKAIAGFWVAYVLFSMMTVIKRVPKEDEVMRKEFGEQWIEWSKRTRYALVPFIY